MAAIIKSRVGKSALVLKHSEYPFFERLPRQIITSIREKYIVLLYFGYHTVAHKDFEYADGYIAASGVLELQNSKLPRLNLNGYNFIPERFISGLPVERRFLDFLFVGDVTPRKGLLEVLYCLNELASIREYKACLVIRTNSNNLFYRIHERRVRKFISERCSQAMMRNVSFVFSDAGCGFKLDSLIIQNLMQGAKCLLLPSRKEGAARVFAEAKLAQMDTICFEGMRGGTLSRVFSNDFLYKTPSQLIGILSNYEYLGLGKDEVIKIQDSFSTVASTQKFREFLMDFNDSSSLSASVEPEAMYNMLSGHRQDLPRGIPSTVNTDECLSTASMYRLGGLLLGKELRRYRLIFKIQDFQLSVERWMKIVGQKIKNR